ncbi:MAG TPA: hypothetical protein VLA05_11905 [Coriobacteriia bacterium]|nr:hypothetical protein [Coriobacteriia bacterium]
MDPQRPLAPCLIGRGTVASYRDMLRALETLETVTYRFLVDGDVIHEGQAALVKLMADSESSTLVVNGCLFLNVASFRYLDFEQDAEETWRFTLHGDGSNLELIAVPEADEEAAPTRPHLLSEEMAPDFDALIALDEDDEED